VDVKLDIYNVMGQKVVTLVDHKQAAGSYQLIWDAKNHYGSKVATGIYFYRLIAGDKFVQTKKMLLVK
jgi:flagellar hook assembly protein FlgD